MRAYAIALFFLLLQVSGTIIGLTGVFPDVEARTDTELLTHLNDTMQNREYGNQTLAEYILEYERSGISDSLGTFGKAVSVKHQLIKMGSPETVAQYVAYGVYFVYILGIVQLVLLRKGLGDVA